MTRRPSRFWILFGLLLAATVAAGAVLITTRGSGSPATVATRTPAAYAAAVKHNYRTLTAAQTRQLFRFAQAYASCMRTRFPSFGRPVARRTRITMLVPPHLSMGRALRVSVACGERLGGPPAQSSLVLRGRLVELYLPKRCLLDPKVSAKLG